MRKLFSVFIIFNLIVLNACDDGDVITVELDFDENFEVCDGGDDLVFFKTKNDPSESLSLKLSNVTLASILAVDEFGVFENTYTISTNNPFNYRTYSNATLPSNLFCNVIPNSDVNITQDIRSISGTAELKTVLTEDDNDGIPAELEDINGNGDLTDDDTDGDGLPNYIDADDDGDNVLTREENPDPNGDGNLSDALNTDKDFANGDDIPDYLDADDDGDGINTRDEESDSQDQNPRNDTTIDNIPDYLNKDQPKIIPLKATKYNDNFHKITQTYSVTLQLFGIDLTIISLDNLGFGILENSNTTANRTVPSKDLIFL